MQNTNKPIKTATGLTIINGGTRVEVFFERELQREDFKIMEVIKKLIK